MSKVRWPQLAAIALLVAGVAACGSSGASGQAGSTPTDWEPAEDGEGPYENVDVCSLATAAEIEAVMGVPAHDPQSAMMGPGAGIEGAEGCTWQLGDSIDLFDVWIYPAGARDVKTALDDFWADGYEMEPIAGFGDEAYAAVWRGSESVRAVGQVAGVGVKQGGKAVLLSTLLIGEDYLDPKPGAKLALDVLGRF